MLVELISKRFCRNQCSRQARKQEEAFSAFLGTGPCLLWSGHSKDFKMNNIFSNLFEETEVVLGSTSSVQELKIKRPIFRQKPRKAFPKQDYNTTILQESTFISRVN
jgi:hypothetical protein